MKQIKFIDHLNMTVRNLDESLDWYARVFGFEWVESGEREGVRWAIIRSGEAMLCLYEYPDRIYEGPYAEVPHHGIRHFVAVHWQPVGIGPASQRLDDPIEDIAPVFRRAPVFTLATQQGRLQDRQ